VNLDDVFRGSKFKILSSFKKCGKTKLKLKKNDKVIKSILVLGVTLKQNTTGT